MAWWSICGAAAISNTPICKPSPERRALVLEALVEIDAMLQRLPARAREAFLLAQLGGYTYAEIGQRLDVSERMVKKYMAQVMLQCLLIADGVW